MTKLDLDNPRTIEKELKREPSFEAALAEHALVIKEEAKRIAPTGPPADPYKDSIEVVTQGESIYVAAKDFKALWIEYGTAERTQETTGRETGRMPAYAPLRRAVLASGLRLDEKARKEVK